MKEKELAMALLDLLDGQTARDIRAQTGLPEARCEELVKLWAELYETYKVDWNPTGKEK